MFKLVCNNKLKVHIKENHPKEIKCNMCDEKFDQTFKLENHLKKHEVETFNCEKCEKTFYLKWRLEKHKTIHENINIKFCHYFNNSKLCPFEEIGCMFLHAKSQLCRFKQSCKNDLCQFQHAHDVIGKTMSGHSADQTDDAENSRTDKTTTVANDTNDSSNDLEAVKISNGRNVDENVDNEFDSDLESEEGEDLECEDCGKVSDNFDLYIEHRGMGGCAYYCDPCNETFRYEKDLKMHEQKHCTKCGNEFSPEKNTQETQDKLQRI
jgi:hypothetical protein